MINSKAKNLLEITPREFGKPDFLRIAGVDQKFNEISQGILDIFSGIDQQFRYGENVFFFKTLTTAGAVSPRRDPTGSLRLSGSCSLHKH